MDVMVKMREWIRDMFEITAKTICPKFSGRIWLIWRVVCQGKAGTRYPAADFWILHKHKDDGYESKIAAGYFRERRVYLLTCSSHRDGIFSGIESYFRNVLKFEIHYA